MNTFMEPGSGVDQATTVEQLNWSDLVPAEAMSLTDVTFDPKVLLFLSLSSQSAQ